jgi:hypothetical protein
VEIEERNAISCILSIQICSKIYANILVFDIKEGKNAQEVKKILTVIYHYLLEGAAMAEGHVCGSVLPRKFLKFETHKYHFLHSEHPNLLQNVC